MEKIYLVIADFGSWDSHHKEVVKAFESKEVAESYAEKYDRIISKVSIFSGDSFDLYEEKSDTDDKACDTNDYKIWAKYDRKFGEFNKSSVSEVGFIGE